jgi:transcriptional regulator with XRE-family HTH domain
MSKVSDNLNATTRNSISLVMQRLATTSNKELAAELGLDPTALSRIKNDKKSNDLMEIKNCCALFEKLGLKVIPGHYECYDKRFVESIFFLARLSMNRASEVNDYQHAEIAPRLEEFGY